MEVGFENSTAIYRWVYGSAKPAVPAGTKEIVCHPSGSFRTFCPRVTIATQRNAFDAQAETVLVKFRRAVAHAHRAEMH
jgi:hypothetical protein